MKEKPEIHRNPDRLSYLDDPLFPSAAGKSEGPTVRDFYESLGFEFNADGSLKTQSVTDGPAHAHGRCLMVRSFRRIDELAEWLLHEGIDWKTDRTEWTYLIPRRPAMVDRALKLGAVPVVKEEGMDGYEKGQGHGEHEKGVER